MAKILLSAFADEYSNSFDKQIDYLVQNDMSYIELRFLDGKNIADIGDAEAKEVAKKLADANIGVSAIGSPLGKINIADDFGAHMDKAKRVFETANIVGGKNIRMFSFYLPEGATREESLCSILQEAESVSLRIRHT